MKKILVSSLLIFSFLLSHSQKFITRDGNILRLKGDTIHLRGMAFGNLVWDETNPPSRHHSEIDYQRLESLGMNAIRFYMSYKTFENDANPYTYKQSGWDWIDQNIEWAKKHNIYLILNMHVPQGGYQSQCKGVDLWETPENQKRLAALWKAIANKYQNESQIAGFDILNEPTPSTSILDWSNLAQGIIDSIRTTDNNHLIITERAIALGCDYGYSDENNNYPQITEENLMFTVHMYEPYAFTHQLQDWANTGDGGSYPDENIITAPSDVSYATGNYNNPKISSGTSEWKKYTGSVFTVNTDSIILGRVTFVASKINSGTVYFDDFELTELDQNNNVLRTIFSEPLSEGNFWWWSENGTGDYAKSTDGHLDNFSVSVSGITGASSLTAYEFQFKVAKGHKYRINGWMKGENIPSGASASITTEFYHSPSGQKVEYRNREFIKNTIVGYTKYIEEQNRPVYFGEFGVVRVAFENDKGGERWVKDVISIMDSLNYNFTYHAYKETSFGYYDGWEKPVDTTTVNKKLQNVFKQYFLGVQTSIIKKIDINSFSIYPNPSSDKLIVETVSGKNISYLEILDLKGNVLTKQNTEEINIEFLKANTYIVKVVFEDNTWSSTKFQKL